jgi:hypothetical protein
VIAVHRLLQLKQYVLVPVAFQAAGHFFPAGLDARIAQIRSAPNVPLTRQDGGEDGWSADPADIAKHVG